VVARSNAAPWWAYLLALVVLGAGAYIVYRLLRKTPVSVRRDIQAPKTSDLLEMGRKAGIIGS